ncbi:ABC transporter permease subunit, partial [Proteus mirabilis]|uniref:ABC transporter permease subunit n=1 Tax=Proteus mirabilis TaxID=584 RepID=UPI003F686597
FQTILPELAGELTELRKPMSERPLVETPVAKRMLAACRPHAGVFLTPMAAVAGVLLGQFYGVINPYIGFMAGMKAFTAAVLGGIGSIPGAMIGGLILGIAEALSSAYLSTEYKDVVSFALLILVLL